MEPREARVLAPAKINFFLRILGRRLDGYHLLDSLMVPIDLCDEIVVGIEPKSNSDSDDSTIIVTSDSQDAPGGPTNLAHRAADLLLSKVNIRVAVRIHLTKRIPVGSGLGGGSSDAAAVLVVLNRLLGSPCPIGQLAALGGQIGADVTFFVHGRPARVGGVGEEITPVEGWKPQPLVVCSDGFILSTKMVYSRADLSLTTQGAASNISPFVSGREPIADLLVNDLEVAAAQIHPEVLALKRKLVEIGALGALMTGSGSAVFGVWPDFNSARNAAVTLRAQGLWAEAVETLAVSPAVDVDGR